MGARKYAFTGRGWNQPIRLTTRPNFVCTLIKCRKPFSSVMMIAAATVTGTNAAVDRTMPDTWMARCKRNQRAGTY